MSTFKFTAPPLPHIVISGQDTYFEGGSHAARNKIGVFDLLFVTCGELYLGEGERQWIVGAGQCLLLRPDQFHYSTRSCKEQTHFHWIHFQALGQWMEVLDSSFQEMGEDLYIPANEQIRAAEASPASEDPEGHDAMRLISTLPSPYVQIEGFSIYIPRYSTLDDPESCCGLIQRIELLNLHSSAVSKWEQQVLFQELLMKLKNERRERELAPQITVAERAASYLRDRFRSVISYARLGEDIHFHPNYISKCMKQVYGCTPLEYVTKYRIEQAKLMLMYTNDPIGKIAEDSGFGSFPFFVRTFYKHTGLRPREYRMQYRI
ncbi:helix-turn-helix transcriptional regulator [Paenibacillus solisilvae]|uniref:Helix-turn-helix transcriptional regulator n=1 Tax=Paenibacillus solisilvae TaxID=2486751 RepID=A0ABW0W634_9BACL